MNILQFLAKNFIPKKAVENLYADIFVLSVAKDYARNPTGPDGIYGGAGFRRMMFDALIHNDKIVVDLDGTVGYGSSWLFAAFSDMPKEFQSRIILKSEDKSYIHEIMEYYDIKGNEN